MPAKIIYFTHSKVFEGPNCTQEKKKKKSDGGQPHNCTHQNSGIKVK